MLRARTVDVLCTRTRSGQGGRRHRSPTRHPCRRGAGRSPQHRLPGGGRSTSAFSPRETLVFLMYAGAAVGHATTRSTRSSGFCAVGARRTVPRLLAGFATRRGRDSPPPTPPDSQLTERQGYRSHPETERHTPTQRRRRGRGGRGGERTLRGCCRGRRGPWRHRGALEASARFVAEAYPRSDAVDQRCLASLELASRGVGRRAGGHRADGAALGAAERRLVGDLIFAAGEGRRKAGSGAAGADGQGVMDAASEVGDRSGTTC